MGIILGSEIIDRASKILRDKTNVRWPRAELLDWLNDGQREICLARPNAYVRNDTVQLTFGTKQELPENGIMFLKIARNMGIAGNKPGRVPVFIDMEVIDAQNPNWHSDNPSPTVIHYTFDERDPKIYYVYPPQPNANQGQVDLVFAAHPPKITDAGLPIQLDDIYVNALVDYILYRGFSKDPANRQLKEDHYQAFIMLLIAKDGAEKENNPPAKRKGGA